MRRREGAKVGDGRGGERRWEMEEKVGQQWEVGEDEKRG